MFPGTGGVFPGTGGVGGVFPGTGGVFPGTGGVLPGSGGVFPGTRGIGGTFPGTGEVGGAFPGTGFQSPVGGFTSGSVVPLTSQGNSSTNDTRKSLPRTIPRTSVKSPSPVGPKIETTNTVNKSLPQVPLPGQLPGEFHNN